MTAEEGGVTPTLTAADLASAVPELSALAQVSVTTMSRTPGASLTFENLIDAREETRRHVAAGAGGVVVTQGTDSLEETAYLLDLLWDHPEPLVVTGAMRHPRSPGADGPGNLYGSMAVAASPDARHRGCMVVFGDEIHSARSVAKIHSVRLAAFASPGTGPVGLVCEGSARFWAPAAERLPAVVLDERPPPRVALVTAVLGGTGDDVRAALRDGVDGIVVAAMGGGHVPERMLAAIAEATALVPVAVASRTGVGPLLRSTYAFTGSELDLRRLGTLDAGGLDALKARVLLTVVLWSERDRGRQEALFRRFANGV